MQYTGSIDNRGILEIIRRSCSYVDARLMNHGYRVAYIVSEMLKPYFHEDARKIRDVCFLALLHDIGAYKTDEISKMLQFDTDDVLAHSVYGYLFIKYFSPLKKLSGAILLHHPPGRFWSIRRYFRKESGFLPRSFMWPTASTSPWRCSI